MARYSLFVLKVPLNTNQPTIFNIAPNAQILAPLQFWLWCYRHMNIIDIINCRWIYIPVVADVTR